MVNKRKLSAGPFSPGQQWGHLVKTKDRWGLMVARWFLLFFFTAGYLSTRQVFASHGLGYFLLSLGSLIACELLLTRLHASIRLTFPIWILLAIFCAGYYFQFYLLASDPMVSTGQVVVSRDAGESLLLNVYATTALGFCAFCLTAWWMLGRNRRARNIPVVRGGTASLPAQDAESLCAGLLVTILLLELITGYVSWAAHIAVMGAEIVALPYRMAGVVFYTRTVLLPALLLLLVCMADQHGLKRRFQLGVLLLMIHGVSDAILRSSRSSLVFMFLALMFLVILTGRMNRRRWRFIAACLVLSLLLFPVLTAYRYVRGGSNISDIVAPLREGIGSTYLSENFGEIVLDTWATLVFRATGMNSLLEIAGSGSGPLGFHRVNGVTPFFNEEIMNVPADAVTSYAPSLIGWFYLVGGNTAVVFGILAFVAAVQAIWQALASSNLHARPIAQALFLLLLVYAATDGVLDLLFWWVLVAVVSVAAAELLLRSSRPRPVIAPTLGNSAYGRHL